MSSYNLRLSLNIWIVGLVTTTEARDSIEARKHEHSVVQVFSFNFGPGPNTHPVQKTVIFFIEN